MNPVPAIEAPLHALQPICSARRVPTGTACGTPAAAVAQTPHHRRMQRDGAKPRRQPRRDIVPSLPRHHAIGDGHLCGPHARDGAPMRRPPGMRHLWASHSIPAHCLGRAPDRARGAGVMIRLRTPLLVFAVAAGDYAALMLIDGQLTDFGVSAAVCAGSLVATGLIAYADRRRREAVARARAAVWERRAQQAASGADQPCPLCGGACQKPSESPRFVDRQGMRLCGACAPAINRGPAR
ncbi:MAG: hypothetical protein QOJ56_1491 [Mycobacterium sp.]|jgi:hypothetical protein|nr:hypothetical protein [Mycobacterium sp.]MDT7720839.1 hypothetical protein [Mycobacterium sp.]